jgi:nucleotide-binding universal stress UspA family protein
MYSYVLIATDGSELAGKAVEQGLALAKALGAKVTVVTVSESWLTLISGDEAVAFPIEEYEAGCAASAAKILASVDVRAKAAGIACDTLHVKDQYPAEGIIETANARGCDLIVMASHGRRGVSRLLLGSQANQVVTHSTVPVLICR